MSRIATSELEQGQCVELYHAFGLDDGLLAGYVIHFGGKWDAYVRRGNDLVCVGCFDEKEQAIEAAKGAAQ